MLIFPVAFDPLIKPWRSRMHNHRSFIFSLSTALALAGLMLGCAEEKFDFILPQIAVDACSESVVVVAGRKLGGTSNCGAPFGEAVISTDSSKLVRIFNPSSVPLTITRISLEKGDQSPFRIDHAPQRIDAGKDGEVQLSYRADREIEVMDDLLIESNAGNLTKGEVIRVKVTAKGVDRGLPSLELSSQGCEFGPIAIEQAAQCEITLRNKGQRTLLIESLQIEGSELSNPASAELAAFQFQGKKPVSGEKIEKGKSIQLFVRFLPHEPGQASGKLRVKSNDPMEPIQEVSLSGEGVLPPIAVCGIKTVNGQQFSRTKGIEPLDNVVVTAEGSHATAPNATLKAFEWKVVRRPPGSTMEPHQPTEMETPFYFSNNAYGVDLAGQYAVQLTVEDSNNIRSTNECLVEFEAIPSDSIHVQLVWDTEYGDMDLHLMKKDDQNQFCASSLNARGTPGPIAKRCETVQFDDCNYGNCRPSRSSKGPDWDGLEQTPSDGDPTLDVDDTSGFGPENINIGAALHGSYLVSVHSYSGGRPSGNTVRIYLYGQLAAEFYKVLAPDEWWETAIIHLPDQMSAMPCIEDLSTERLECPL